MFRELFHCFILEERADMVVLLKCVHPDHAIFDMGLQSPVAYAQTY